MTSEQKVKSVYPVSSLIELPDWVEVWAEDSKKVIRLSTHKERPQTDEEAWDVAWMITQKRMVKKLEE